MKRSLPLLLGFAAALTVALTAEAAGEFRSGKDVMVGLEGWYAEDSTETVRDALAFGYVIGVHDALAGTEVCHGDQVTQGEVVRIVLEFMRRNPEMLERSADRVVTAALKAVWPCANT
jgi:D-tyrosyl-tRNA(Tyr) deacylase